MTTASFIKSAVFPDDYPDASKPEVAIVGRSNAGKSSLLNSMCGKPGLAKISNTPGKTRLINFFAVGEHYRFVDLPGYGFAARDFKEREMWSQMIHTFFKIRTNLVGFILVCDVRRTWTPEEQSLLEMAETRGLKCTCVLTKIDKLSRVDSQKQFKGWLQSSGQNKEFFWAISSLKNDGVKELEEGIFKAWIKPLR